jgi:hypothetical protein
MWEAGARAGLLHLRYQNDEIDRIFPNLLTRAPDTAPPTDLDKNKWAGTIWHCELR